jgi:hypothetical protein
MIYSAIYDELTPMPQPCLFGEPGKLYYVSLQGSVDSLNFVEVARYNGVSKIPVTAGDDGFLWFGVPTSTPYRYLRLCGLNEEEEAARREAIRMANERMMEEE